MRHWQPIHHERWRGFVESLAAFLRGERPAPVPPPVVAPPAVLVAPAVFPPPPVVAAPEPAFTPPAPETVLPLVETAVADASIRDPEPLPPSYGQPVRRPSTARAFFSALGWGGGAANFPAALPDAPVPPARGPSTTPCETPPQFAPAGRQSEAGPFFRTLPWDGRRAPGDAITSIRVTASREDDRLDPRTASLPADNLLLTGMLSAARTSDRAARQAGRNALAGAFFHDLPWSRQPDQLLP